MAKVEARVAGVRGDEARVAAVGVRAARRGGDCCSVFRCALALASATLALASSAALASATLA